MTEWKTIPGSESKMMYYQSSNDMQVRSVNKKTEKTKILSQSKCKGYLTVGVKKPSSSVHILIALTWVEKPPNYNKTFTVDHIDNNPMNNLVVNLQWLSKRDQNLKRRKNDRTKNNAMPVYGKNIKTGIETYFESACDAAEKIEGNQGHISECINKKRKTHKGCTWRPPEILPDLPGEIWFLRHKNHQYEIYYSLERVAFKYECGYIKKLDTDKFATERGIDENDAYPTIKFEGEHKQLHVDRWEFFNGSIPEGKVINHKDHNKRNATMFNLELTDQSGNLTAAHDVGRYDETKTARQPVMIDGEKYTSKIHAADVLGVSDGTIGRWCNDLRKQNCVKL